MDPVTQTSTPDLAALTRDAFQGCSISRDDALRVLQAPDDDVMAIVAAAGQVRRRFFGNRVKLNYLVNLKSGMCPEDCGYCSQSLRSGAQILRYSWLSSDEVAEAVAAGVDRGASTVCLVASGRGPSHREIEHVAGVVADIHRDHPDVRICTCLGFIDESKATRLADAGSSRYNHNLNTASSHYPDVCTTHTYTDRVQTVAAASTGGLSACSGLIAGMGESDEQLVDVAFGLRDLEVDSVPVNFLLPFEGTPLESYRELTPQRCLKTLAMVRFVHPDAEVRAAAGREYHLRTLQPLALEVCTSIFLGDYLTSDGQSGDADLQMIRDLGFEIDGAGPVEDGRACAGEQGTALEAVLDQAGVPLRHRGVGTPLAPNA